MDSSETKRTELKNKVAAAQKRNEERSFSDYARDATDEATTFVKDHPFAVVLGGLALGVVVASLVPGPGRRLRKKATRRSAALAGTIADLAMSYGSQFLDEVEDAADAGKDRLGRLGNAARREAGSLTDSAEDGARDIRRAAARTIRDLRARMAH